MTKVIVVGGGIVGASAALNLAQMNVETVLVDRRHDGQATAAGAGIITPGTSLRPIPAFVPFGTAAVNYYPELLAELKQLGQERTGYAAVGKLFIAWNDTEAAQLEEVFALIRQRQSDGVPNIGEAVWIDPGEAVELFPALAMPARAVHIPGAARVDGSFLRDALLSAGEQLGVQRHDGSAELAIEGGKVQGVAINGEVITADSVILAGGAWSSAMLEQLDRSVPVAPQRGQILHMHLPERDTTTWPIIGDFGSQYMLTFGPNRVVSGATRETGTGFDVRQTVAGTKHIVDYALRVAPGLAEATIHEVRVGLRPFSEDGMPFLDRVAGYENVIIAAGHGPSGLQLGPFSGRLVAQLASGTTPEYDLAPFRWDREIIPLDSTE